VFYLGRGFNGMAPDLLVRSDGGRILAAVSLNYRQIAVSGREPMWVAVASAGTTLPEERRQGHYGVLMRAAIRRCRERGGVALLGFVTRDNGSGRGLNRLGALSVPSFYLTSARPPLGANPVKSRVQPRALTLARERTLRERTLREVLAMLASRKLSSRFGVQPAQARLYYERLEDWASQLVCRPYPVRAVHLAHDSLALVERVDSTDRLQWLACPDSKMTAHIATLAAASAAEGRRFFMYTLDPLVAEAARRTGLKARSGCLMLQPVDGDPLRFRELAEAHWHIDSGDRL
jgi:GNAT superfamily N-acetyltransferase